MQQRTWQRLLDRLEPGKGNQLSLWITLNSGKTPTWFVIKTAMFCFRRASFVSPDPRKNNV
jgi:hypothetical protein